MQNFQRQLPKALSQKQQIFPAIFTSFLKSTSNLEHFFLKKDESPSLSISQIIDSERGGFLERLKRLPSEHLPAINVVTV